MGVGTEPQATGKMLLGKSMENKKRRRESGEGGGRKIRTEEF